MPSRSSATRTLAGAERLLAELLRANADARFVEAADYDDPFSFADGFVNNLPAIAYALGAGMPAIEWQQAAKNPNEAERVLRSVRQWSEQARYLILLLAAGALTIDQFYDQLVIAYRTQARNSYVAGKRAVGDLRALTEADEAAIDEMIADDAQRLNSLRNNVASGGIGSLIASMILDPTNYFGSGLPGDPFAPKHAEDAAKQLGRYGQRVEQYGKTIASYANRGELDAITGAFDGGATYVWWVLGNADHCIDCIRLSDLSPFNADQLNGIYPGAGYTRCGSNCSCYLSYDIPSVVCADPFSGPGLADFGLGGEFTESESGVMVPSLVLVPRHHKVNVWVQEAASCSLPMSINSLGYPGDYDALDSEAAFDWNGDMQAQIRGSLDDSEEWERISAYLARAYADVARTAPDALRGARVARYSLPNVGSEYTAVWRDTGDALRFEAGAVTRGVPTVDSDYTVRVLRDLGERAAAEGKRLEVNGQFAGPGMRKWLETIGADSVPLGSAPHVVAAIPPAPQFGIGAGGPGIPKPVVQQVASTVPPEVDALPGWPDLSLLKPDTPEAVKALGGASKKQLLVDPAGNRWLFKTNPDDIEAEAAAARLAQKFGLRTPPARIATIGDQRGVLIPIIPDSRTLQSQYEYSIDAIKALTPSQARELARESVLDFVIANRDTHYGNWLTDADDRLWGIDRGLGFKGAVATSANPASFWTGPTGTLFGGAMDAPDASRILLKLDPADVGRALDALDALDDARFLSLVGDRAIDMVASPLGDHAAKAAALLKRKHAARAGYEQLFADAINKASTSSVSPRWRTWLEAGGRFSPQPVAAATDVVPAIPFALPTGTARVTGAATASKVSRVGTNRAVWQAGFSPAATRATARQRLFGILTGAPDTTVLDGFTTDQLNAILARAEFMRDKGVDLTRISSLADYRAVPEATAKQGIGLTLGDRIALDHRFEWTARTGTAKPTAYEDIGGLFAHEAGHTLWNSLGVDARDRMLALYKRHAGEAAKISDYATTGVDEWFGEVFATITQPGYQPGAVPFDADVWGILAADGKVRAVERGLVAQPPPFEVPPLTLKPVDAAKPKLGGLSTKAIYTDASGTEWLVKPKKVFADSVEKSRAAIDLEQAVKPLGDLVGVNVAPVATHTIDFPWVAGGDLKTMGVSAQPLIPGVKGLPLTSDGKVAFEQLTDEQLNDLMGQQVFDWLVGNDDGHIGQFLIGADGKMVGIDKDAAFWEIGSQYALGNSTPEDGLHIAHTVWDGMTAERLARIQPEGIARILDRVDAIAPDEYAHYLEPHLPILEAHPNGVKVSAAQRKAWIMQRKAELRADFDGYYRRQLAQLQEQGVTLPDNWASWLKAGGQFAEATPHVLPTVRNLSPKMVAKARADALAVRKTVEDVTAGKVDAAISWTASHSVYAVDHGLAFRKIGGLRIYAKDTATLDRLSAYLAEPGHATTDDALWKMLGYSDTDLRKMRRYEELKRPAYPKEEVPVGATLEPQPMPKKAWFEPGDTTVYNVPGHPTPLNVEPAPWSGKVPDEPPLPSTVKGTTEQIEAARAAADKVRKTVEDVTAGKAEVAWSWREADVKAAKDAGLVYTKIGDARLIARSDHDLDPFRAYLAKQGNGAGDDEFWHLLGYTDRELDIIDAADDIAKGKRLTAGVMIVEPDGRMWIMAPRNKWAGYENTVIKGGVDPGESIAQGAVREAREEAGFSVELDGYLGDYENTDHTSITRMYIAHRTGGGPRFAKIKETYQARLVTPDEAKDMLTRYGKPDARDQAILADTVTALGQQPGLIDYSVPAGAVEELAAKLTPSSAAPPIPEVPRSKKAQFGVAPISAEPIPAAQAFHYDGAAVKNLAAEATESPPADKFPYYGTRYKMPSGETATMYWRYDELPSTAEKVALPTSVGLAPESPAAALPDGVNLVVDTPGTGTVRFVKGADDSEFAGKRYVFKVGTPESVARDEAAARLAKALGTRTPDVAPSNFYDGTTLLHGSVQPRIEGQTLDGVDLATLTPAQKTELMQHAVVDALVDNGDPNLSNYILGVDGHIWALDRTESFHFEGPTLLPEWFAQLTKQPGLLNEVAPGDIAAVFGRLGKLSDDQYIALLGDALPADLREAALVRKHQTVDQALSKPLGIKAAVTTNAEWKGWVASGSTLSNAVGLSAPKAQRRLFWANSKKQISDPIEQWQAHVAQITRMAAQTAVDPSVVGMRISEDLLGGQPKLRELLIAGGGEPAGKYVEIDREHLIDLGESIKNGTALPESHGSPVTGSLYPTPTPVTARADLDLDELNHLLSFGSFTPGETGWEETAFATWTLANGTKKSMTHVGNLAEGTLHIAGPKTLGSLYASDKQAIVGAHLYALAEPLNDQLDLVRVALDGNLSVDPDVLELWKAIGGTVGEDGAIISVADLSKWAKSVKADLAHAHYDPINPMGDLNPAFVGEAGAVVPAASEAIVAPVPRGVYDAPTVAKTVHEAESSALLKAVENATDTKTSVLGFPATHTDFSGSGSMDYGEVWWRRLGNVLEAHKIAGDEPTVRAFVVRMAKAMDESPKISGLRFTPNAVSNLTPDNESAVDLLKAAGAKDYPGGLKLTRQQTLALRDQILADATSAATPSPAVAAQLPHELSDAYGFTPATALKVDITPQKQGFTKYVWSGAGTGDVTIRQRMLSKQIVWTGVAGDQPAIVDAAVRQLQLNAEQLKANAKLEGIRFDATQQLPSPVVDMIEGYGGVTTDGVLSIGRDEALTLADDLTSELTGALPAIPPAPAAATNPGLSTILGADLDQPWKFTYAGGTGANVHTTAALHKEAVMDITHEAKPETTAIHAILPFGNHSEAEYAGAFAAHLELLGNVAGLEISPAVFQKLGLHGQDFMNALLDAGASVDGGMVILDPPLAKAVAQALADDAPIIKPFPATETVQQVTPVSAGVPLSAQLAFDHAVYVDAPTLATPVAETSTQGAVEAMVGGPGGPNVHLEWLTDELANGTPALWTTIDDTAAPGNELALSLKALAKHAETLNGPKAAYSGLAISEVTTSHIGGLADLLKAAGATNTHVMDGSEVWYISKGKLNRLIAQIDDDLAVSPPLVGSAAISPPLPTTPDPIDLLGLGDEPVEYTAALVGQGTTTGAQVLKTTSFGPDYGEFTWAKTPDGDISLVFQTLSTPHGDPLAAKQQFVAQVFVVDDARATGNILINGAVYNQTPEIADLLKAFGAQSAVNGTALQMTAKQWHEMRTAIESLVGKGPALSAASAPTSMAALGGWTKAGKKAWKTPENAMDFTGASVQQFTLSLGSDIKLHVSVVDDGSSLSLTNVQSIGNLAPTKQQWADAYGYILGNVAAAAGASSHELLISKKVMDLQPQLKAVLDTAPGGMLMDFGAYLVPPDTVGDLATTIVRDLPPLGSAGQVLGVAAPTPSQVDDAVKAMLTPSPAAAAAPAGGGLSDLYGVNLGKLDSLTVEVTPQAQNFAKLTFSDGATVKARISGKSYRIEGMKGLDETDAWKLYQHIDPGAGNVVFTPTAFGQLPKKSQDLLLTVGDATPSNGSISLTADEWAAFKAKLAAEATPGAGPVIPLDVLQGFTPVTPGGLTPAATVEPLFPKNAIDEGILGNLEVNAAYSLGSHKFLTRYTDLAAADAGVSLGVSGDLSKYLSIYTRHYKGRTGIDKVMYGTAEQRAAAVTKRIGELLDSATASNATVFVSGEITRELPQIHGLMVDLGAVKKNLKVGNLGDVYEIDKADVKKALDIFNNGAIEVAAPAPTAAIPTPPIPSAAAPSPTGLGSLYGYDATSLQNLITDKATSLAHDTVSATKLTQVYEDAWATGVAVKYAEEQQGAARILKIRSISLAPNAYGGGTQALLASMQTSIALHLADHPDVARVLVTKKALEQAPISGMLADAGWKETKDYWVIARDDFNKFAVDLQADQASWAKASTIANAPTPAAVITPPGVQAAAPLKAAPATGTASPSFIYDYDTAGVKANVPKLVDSVRTDASLQAGAVGHSLVVDGVEARWSVSPSGKTVGWSELLVPSTATAKQKADAAFAQMRYIAEQAQTREGFFWIKPEVYDQVPGLRQMLIDAGGNETAYPKLGTAVQMKAGDAKNLVAAIDSDTMTGLTISAKSASDYLGFDPAAVADLTKLEPTVTARQHVWKVAGKDVKLNVKGNATDGITVSGWSGTPQPAAAMAELAWASEVGLPTMVWERAALEGVPKLDKFLLAIGAKVQNNALVLDAATINTARKVIGHDALPALLGGDAIPYSVLDDLNASIDHVIAAAHSELQSASKLSTRSSFKIGENTITTLSKKSETSIYWESITRETRLDASGNPVGVATVGNQRNAAAAQLRSFLNAVAQNASLQRLDIDHAVLTAMPAMRDVLLRYGATDITDGGRSFVSLERIKAMKLRKELETELAQVVTPGANTSYISQQVALIKWPSADELQVSQTALAKKVVSEGQTRKHVLRDADGNEWLFKPGASGRGAMTDRAVAQLAELLGLPVPPARIYTVEIGGKKVTGSLAKLIPGAKSMAAAGTPTPASLNAVQTEDMLRHSILDWLTNNDDAHVGNWMTDPDGHLWAIDKSRSWVTFHGSHDVLNTASEGNGGGTPWLFLWWRQARQDPNLLTKVHPSTFSSTLRKLTQIDDDAFRRIVDPVARAKAADPRTAGRYLDKADQLIADMIARKNSVVADFERYVADELKTIKQAGGTIPADWQQWLGPGKAKFNLNATPRDLWVERKAYLDAKWGDYSPAKAKQLMESQTYSKLTDAIRRYFGAGFHGAGFQQGYGAETIRKTLTEQGLGQAVADWQELQEWSFLNVVNGKESAFPQFDDEVRRWWNPDTGTLRVIRTTNRYGKTPQRYIDEYSRSGMRDMVGTSVGKTTTVAGGNGVVLYLEVPWHKIFSQYIMGYGAGGGSSVGYEAEYLIAGPTVADIRHIRPASNRLTASEWLKYDGPPVIQTK